jgi:hypothetical protein
MRKADAAIVVQGAADLPMPLVGGADVAGRRVTG